MRIITTLFALIIFYSCSPGVQVNNDESVEEVTEERIIVEDYSFSDSTSESNSESSNEEVEDEDSESDSEEVDEEESTEESDDSNSDSSDELINLCGTIYRTIDNTIEFIQDGTESELIITATTSSAEGVVEGIEFPNDARTACIWGNYKQTLTRSYQTSKTLYFTSRTISYTTVDSNEFETTNIQIDIYENPDHPDRMELQEQYSYSKCGEIFTNVDYVDQAENISTVQIKDDVRTYYIVSEELDEDIRDEINAANGTINGCVYGNSEDYLDASRSSKRIFEYEEMDIGWY